MKRLIMMLAAMATMSSAAQEPVLTVPPVQLSEECSYYSSNSRLTSDCAWRESHWHNSGGIKNVWQSRIRRTVKGQQNVRERMYDYNCFGDNPNPRPHPYGDTKQSYCAEQETELRCLGELEQAIKKRYQACIDLLGDHDFRKGYD